MLHPSTRLTWVGDEVGYGVVATEFIPRGTITWVLDPLDRVLSPTDTEELAGPLTPVLERYSYVSGRGRRLLLWDFGRYMNHSCAANVLSPGADLEIAIRDIHRGEELTCDYGELNIERPLECLCGSSACRGTIGREDFELMTGRWDHSLRLAFAAASGVRQPLLGFVEDKDRLHGWMWDPGSVPSAALNQFRGIDAVARAFIH